MKSFRLLYTMLMISFLGFTAFAQDKDEERLNLPGDNLNLYAVMNLFRESETLEAFEKNLNAEDSKINNLDLNADNKIDYIKVVDFVDGDAHTIVLQVAVNEKENQDVAVFTVQKDAKSQVQVQLIGDEELYGKDYIIEPNYAEEAAGETPNPGYSPAPTTVEKETVVVTRTTYVEVAAWPVVTFMFRPTYVVYRSPWYWGYYPPYWNPWQPYYWDYYYGYHSHYHHHYYGYYHHSHYNRYPHYRDNYYHGHRSYSNTVNQHRQSGSYRNTYSRPETRQQGSADFVKKYPDGYRPSARPGTNPGVNRPSAKPGTGNNVNRPATRPGNNTNTNRPATKPGTNTNRPSAKPGTNTNVNRPATKPGSAKPATRPDSQKPSTKPAITTPSARPENARPSTKPNVSQPSSRPSGTTKQKPSEVRTPQKQSAPRQATPAKKADPNKKSRIE